jgi:DNA-binding response OmpR family regulator
VQPRHSKQKPFKPAELVARQKAVRAMLEEAGEVRLAVQAVCDSFRQASAAGVDAVLSHELSLL